MSRCPDHDGCPDHDSAVGRAGGIWLDRLGATSSWNATVVCLVAIAGGAVTVQVAFALCYRLLPFMVLFAAGEFLLFMIQSPLTTLILLSVPTDLRPLAFSVQTISIHVFGDVPAPPAAAWIHDHVFQKDDSVRPEPLCLPLYPTVDRVSCLQDKH